MKRRTLRNAKRIERRLFFGVISTIVLAFVLAILAVFVWVPIVIGEGVLICAYGTLQLIAAHKSWDRYFSFYNNGMADDYWKRHRHTVFSGVAYILLGLSFTILLSLVFLGVIG